jgi:uncharacterized membrane protein
MDRAADETAKIEHELEILRSRYGIMVRWARIMKWYVIGLAVVLTSVGVGYGLVYDPLVAAIIAVVVTVLGVAFYLTRDRNWRWIDCASPRAEYAKISEAAAIETMIAEREARLADIRKKHA